MGSFPAAFLPSERQSKQCAVIEAVPRAHITALPVAIDFTVSRTDPAPFSATVTAPFSESLLGAN